MKKQVLVIADDYWHPIKSIEPLMPLLFPENEWNLTFTTDPKTLFQCQKVPDLFVTFKDPIENDQVPTPIWCDESWTEQLMKNIKEYGMGFLAVHCGVTDLPKEHRISQEILRGYFISHPPQCPVTFLPCTNHPITKGIEPFTFPDVDEHYIIEMLPGTEEEILGYTTSRNGKQVGLWAHELGEGRVCGITPGHNTVNLTYPEYVKLLKNAVLWCCKQ